MQEFTEPALDGARLASVVREISPRAASGVLQHLSATVRDAALAGLPEEQARRVREVLRYPPDTAGAIMDTHVASLPSDVTIQEAIELLRRTPREALTYLYVTDATGGSSGSSACATSCWLRRRTRSRRTSCATC